MKLMTVRAFLSRLAAVAAIFVASTSAVVTAGDRAAAPSVVDMHVHTAGLGAGGSGCFVSPALRDSYKFGWYLRAFGVSRADLEREGDGLVLRRIAEQVAQSRYVHKAVVLAMDGVIAADGELDTERTQIYVPNDFVRTETDRYAQLYYGASINPYRKNALELLAEAKASGAVLIKWIPAIQAIDPADRSLIPYYKKLRELDLPILIHVGQERSFDSAIDRLGDPERLRLPLELGVTVIAAHIATTGENERQRNIDRLVPLFAQYPNLYTDISSLTQLNKLGYLYESLAIPGLSARMLYGSDWPLQFFPLVSPWYQIGRIGFRDILAIGRLGNQWDRDVALKRAMGVPPEVFARSGELLKID